METIIRRSSTKSFVVTFDDINKIYLNFKAVCESMDSREKVKFKVSLSNGEMKIFYDINELNDFQNGKDSRIMRLEISCGFINNCSFDSSGTYEKYYMGESISMNINSQSDKREVIDKIWSVMESTEVWYSWIINNKMKILIFFICLILFFSEPHEILIKNSKLEGIINVYGVLFFILLIIFSSNFMVKLLFSNFPRGVFKLGIGGEKYYNDVMRKRKIFFVVITILIPLVLKFL